MDEPFWGQDIAVVDVEWVGGDSAVLIKHCSSTGDLEWAQQVTADEARGVCWYLARLFGQELHPEGTATKLQEQTTEPLPGDDCRVRVLLQMANEEDASADTWRPDSEKYSEHRARAHNLREAARHIRELEAQVAAFRAPAEAAGYTVSEDGKCWTGNGGGREFFQGPPINVTHGEDPGDYLEDLRAGKEPGMDHLQQADVLSRVDPMAGHAQSDALLALAHATIADAELMVEHLRLVAESVALQRQGVDDRQQADAALMELATREPPPHIRYGAVILRSGRQWCCELSTARAWGDTPAEACAAFDRLWLTGSAEEEGDDQ